MITIIPLSLFWGLELQTFRRTNLGTSARNISDEFHLNSEICTDWVGGGRSEDVTLIIFPVHFLHLE